jgi:hypothetical protein
MLLRTFCATRSFVAVVLQPRFDLAATILVTIQMALCQLDSEVQGVVPGTRALFCHCCISA